MMENIIKKLELIKIDIGKYIEETQDIGYTEDAIQYIDLAIKNLKRGVW